MAATGGGGKLLKGVGAVLLAVTTVVLTAFFGSDDLQASICEKKLPQLGRTSACGEAHHPVAAAEATRFLRSFFGSAGGARPDDAWPMLDPNLRDGLSREDFVKGWTPVLAAELVGQPHKQPDFNTYEARVRKYIKEGPITSPVRGRVAEYLYTVQVRRSASNALRLSRLDTGPKPTDDRAFFPRLRLLVRTPTYREAATDKGIAESADGHHVGGVLTTLCQDTSGPSEFPWVRTDHGWLPPGTIGRPTEVATLPLCGQ